jgi:hypothetical protein
MTDRSTAIHEAARGVIARVLTVRVHACKLVRPPPIAAGFVGLTSSASAYETVGILNANTRIKLAALRIDAKITMAGPAAEARLLGLCLQARRDAWLIDRRHLRRIVADVVWLTGGQEDDVAAKIYNRTAAKAQRLVAQNWRAIQRVAEQLLREGELNQDEIDGLIADAAAAAWPKAVYS